MSGDPKAPSSRTGSEVVIPPASAFERCGDPISSARLAQEQVTVWRPAYLPGVEIWSIANSARLWTMLFDCHSFSGQDQGNAHWHVTHNTLYYRKRTLTVRGRDLLLGSPGEISRVLDTGHNVPFHAVNVFPEAAADYAPELSGFALRALDDERAYHSFTRAWRAVEAPDLDITERESHLRAFLHCAFELTLGAQTPSSATGCERSVQRAREFIHDRYADSIALSDIARAAERSVWYLERSFAASIGAPIHVYLRHVRLARAMELLRLGDKASQVSSAAGFSDQAHMTRTFRRCLGVTPGVYQRALQR
ncbi:MAG: AraC family transcriptional regulator [Polyangiaceae bacterium]